MNQLYYSLIIILFCSNTFAQITVRTVTSKATEINEFQNDTTCQKATFNQNEPRNFEYQRYLSDYSKYIGEEFYFLPKSIYSSNNDTTYSNFCTIKKNKKVPKTKVYKVFKNDKVPRSKIDSKIFKVVDCEYMYDPSINKYKSYNKYIKMGVYFTLMDKNNNTLIWKIPYYTGGYPGQEYNLSDKQTLPPVLLLSYFNAIKSKYVGNTYFAKNTLLTEQEGYNYAIRDLNTNKKIQIHKNEKWKCTDVCIMEGENKDLFKQPFLIFRNNSDNEIKIGITKYMGFYSYEMYVPNISSFRTEEEYIDFTKELVRQDNERKKIINDYINRFGEKYTELILKKQVAVGMSKEMCILSWGYPKDINATTTAYGTSEQWVYGVGRYLYFEGGRLTVVQF